MNESPTATIVITTHDRPALAERAVRSALSQTVPDIEVIVVDDGSMPPFEWRGSDDRLQLLRLDHAMGVCAARNVGLQAARGRWITFLDDDDELLPSMIEISLHAIAGSSLPGPIAALSGIVVTDEAGGVVHSRFPPRLPRGRHYFLEGSGKGSFGVHSTLVAPRETLVAIGGWDEQIRSWEHDDLFLRLNSVCSLEAVDAITYRKPDHPHSRLHDQMLAAAQGMDRTLRKHRRVFALYPRRYAHYLGAMGVAYLKAGRWGSAVAATTQSVVRDPRQFRLLVWWIASLAGPRILTWYRRGRMVVGLRKARR